MTAEGSASALAPEGGSPLLHSLRLLELGGGLAAAVCARMFADFGADTVRVVLPSDAPADDEERAARVTLDVHKRTVPLDPARAAGREALESLVREADLVVLAGNLEALGALGLGPAQLRTRTPRAVVACITPFGLTGVRSGLPGPDLVVFHSSGMARQLMGRVADTEGEPPVRAAGEQSAHIGGISAATAAMHALYRQRAGGGGELIDVSMEEALALQSPRELALPGYGATAMERQAEPGSVSMSFMLQASDGWVAISPREAHQWEAWIEVLGAPAWASESRFVERDSRMAHGIELQSLMGAWCRQRTRAEIVNAAQAAHVPCMALQTPDEVLASPQLAHRRFFRTVPHGEGRVAIAGPPFGLPPSDYAQPLDDAPSSAGAARWRDRLSIAPGSSSVSATGAEGRLPLDGVRVLDFSWVIAGPTCTRLLAAMGADVVKIESASRPDPGRGSQLHSVLGQSKRGLSLNLKSPLAIEAAKRLVAYSDIVVENFASGVMERFGLGYHDLRAIRPDIVLVSTSGLGRTGPEARTVAYGTLVQCYAGFSALIGTPGRPPVTGMAWSDPLCGLDMAFAAVAALYDRRESGRGRHIDFSMVEALLATMPAALFDYQVSGRAFEPQGNRSRVHTPHDVYRCRGEDAWLAVAVTNEAEWRALCDLVPALAPLRALDLVGRRLQGERIDAVIATWARDRSPAAAAEQLQTAGVPASASRSMAELFADRHLHERGFYRLVTGDDGVERLLPGLPWRWGDGETIVARPAPQPDADTERVLREVAAYSADEVASLRAAGALS